MVCRKRTLAAYHLLALFLSGVAIAEAPKYRSSDEGLVIEGVPRTAL